MTHHHVVLAVGPPSSKTGGLGTSLLQALAQQLDAQIADVSTSRCTRRSVPLLMCKMPSI